MAPLEDWSRLERAALHITKFVRRRLHARAIFSGHMCAFRPLVTILADDGSSQGYFYGNSANRPYHIKPTYWHREGGMWLPNEDVIIRTPEDLQVWLTMKPAKWPPAA